METTTSFFDQEVVEDEKLSHTDATLPAVYPATWNVVGLTLNALQLLAFVLSTFFVGAIVGSKDTRKASFNVYLVCLILPDMLLNLVYAIAFIDGSLQENLDDGTTRPSLCVLVNSFGYFYYISNLYLNAMVSYEIYKLVDRSNRMKKYYTPPLRMIYLRITYVYVFAIISSLWVVLEVPWSPYHFSDTDKGNCRSLAGSPNGGIFSKLAAMTVLFSVVMIPVIYVVYVRIKIWRGNLLPISGKTRALSEYFLRILVVYFFFYIPNIIIVIVILPRLVYPAYFWVRQLYFMLTPLQCIVTLYYAMKKDDIKKSVKQLLSRFVKVLETCCITINIDNNDELSGQTEWEQDDIYNNDVKRKMKGRVSSLMKANFKSNITT
mmetsp:Transcript_58769/g.70721  ORF Transcript_58769/g.70721 Transcript_58769/m.70721 type:complete len:378 (+) Transcript_58769:280-1413(+)